LALLSTAIVFAIRYLVSGSRTKAAALIVAVCLSVALPAISFHPEYLKFKANRQSYLTAIDADPSPHPKFKYFQLREFAGFPVGFVSMT
jgi:hypothetical protein